MNGKWRRYLKNYVLACAFW